MHDIFRGKCMSRNENLELGSSHGKFMEFEKNEFHGILSFLTYFLRMR